METPVPRQNSEPKLNQAVKARIVSVGFDPADRRTRRPAGLFERSALARDRILARDSYYKNGWRLLQAHDAILEMQLAAEQPLADIIVLMRDLGTPNAKELYPLRIERINWPKHLIRIPDSKTKAGERDSHVASRRGSCTGGAAIATRGGSFPRVRRASTSPTVWLTSSGCVRARRPGSPRTLSSIARATTTGPKCWRAPAI